MKEPQTVVVKFGGSVQPPSEADPDRMSETAERSITGAVQTLLHRFDQVVAVVSAARFVTTRLHERHVGVDDVADRAWRIADGERISCEIVEAGLRARGISALALEPDETGIKTVGRQLEADPVRLETSVYEEGFRDHRVIVVPGHTGSHEKGATISLLGRGGSDLTAVYLAHGLGLDSATIYNSAGGIYSSYGRSEARLIESLTWEELLGLDPLPIQLTAARYAQDAGLQLFVRGLETTSFTTVTGSSDRRLVARPA